MSRGTRIALLGGAALMLAVSGTVFATRQPQGADEPAGMAQDEEDTPPTAEELVHAESRLEAAFEGLDVDPAVLNDLAARYGLGGAVRLMAWSNETGRAVADIQAMRDTGGPEGTSMGWGRIAKDLGVHPGIGSIMGNGGNGGGNGGGHGRENAPGQQEDQSP